MARPFCDVEFARKCGRKRFAADSAAKKLFDPPFRLLAERMRRDGLSYRNIARDFNTRRMFNRVGRPWSSVMIWKLLNE